MRSSGDEGEWGVFTARRHFKRGCIAHTCTGHYFRRVEKIREPTLAIVSLDLEPLPRESNRLLQPTPTSPTHVVTRRHQFPDSVPSIDSRPCSSIIDYLQQTRPSVLTGSSETYVPRARPHGPGAHVVVRIRMLLQVTQRSRIGVQRQH